MDSYSSEDVVVELVGEDGNKIVVDSFEIGTLTTFPLTWLKVRNV